MQKVYALPAFFRYLSPKIVCLFEFLLIVPAKRIHFVPALKRDRYEEHEKRQRGEQGYRDRGIEARGNKAQVVHYVIFEELIKADA